MDSLIEEIKKQFNNKLEIDEEIPKFSDSGYEAFKITEDKFHEIKNVKNENKIAFIDGGNLEILHTIDFSLNLIRVYYSIFKENKKIKSKKFEFYSLIYADKNNDEICFRTKIFGENLVFNEEKLCFDSMDKTLRKGNNRINISSIGGIIRRFSEILIADKVVDELDKDDIIVLDGSLQCNITNESDFMEDLYKKGIEKGIYITALSKSTNLMTQNGHSITGILSLISPDLRWYYYPIVTIKNPQHKAQMFFVKFHEKSKHIFRFEIFKDQKFDISKILSLLAENSNDPVFLGYPYGLIEADKFARISNNELEYYKTLISAKLGKDILKSQANINGAHEILDKISY